VCAQPALTGYDQFVNLTLYDQVNFQTSTLFYGLYYSIRLNSIDIGVVCDVSTESPIGWCGFGISLSGMMFGANGEISDAVIGYVDDNGVFSIGDFVIKGRNPPFSCQFTPSVCLDTFGGSNCTNNVVSRSGRRQGNYLIMEFTRPLAASDSCDVAINFSSNFIIYVIGNAADTGTFPDTIISHDQRAFANTALTFIPPATTGSGGVTTGAVVTSGVAMTTRALTSGVDATTGVVPAVTTGALPLTTGAQPLTTAAPVVTSADATTGAGEESSPAALAIPAFLMIVFAYFF